MSQKAPPLQIRIYEPEAATLKKIAQKENNTAGAIANRLIRKGLLAEADEKKRPLKD